MSKTNKDVENEVSSEWQKTWFLPIHETAGEAHWNSCIKETMATKCIQYSIIQDYFSIKSTQSNVPTFYSTLEE